jgi:hypothetical protein
MESTAFKKIGLWMDQSHALFLGYDKEEATLLEDFPSLIVSRSRIAGEGSNRTLLGPSPGPASNNEKKKNNIHSNQLSAYFHQLEKKLMDKEELLLMGPGVTKTHFFHHLQANKQFGKLKIEVVDADKMSEKQLLAKVKQKFSPSS